MQCVENNCCVLCLQSQLSVCVITVRGSVGIVRPRSDVYNVLCVLLSKIYIRISIWQLAVSISAILSWTVGLRPYMVEYVNRNKLRSFRNTVL